MTQQEVCQLFEYNADSEDSSMTPYLRNPALSQINTKALRNVGAFYTALSVSQGKACFDSND